LASELSELEGEPLLDRAEVVEDVEELLLVVLHAHVLQGEVALQVVLGQQPQDGVPREQDLLLLAPLHSSPPMLILHQIGSEGLCEVVEEVLGFLVGDQ